MAEQPKTEVTPQPDDDEITTVKVRRGLAKQIRKIGALLEINQEEVMDRFRKVIEDDLWRLSGKTHHDLGKRRSATKSRRDELDAEE